MSSLIQSIAQHFEKTTLGKHFAISGEANGKTTHRDHNLIVDKAATTSPMTKIAIGAGVIGGITLLVAGVATAAFFGAPVLAAAALSLGLVSFLLPTLVGAALISGLSFTAMGLLLAARAHVNGIQGEGLKRGVVYQVEVQPEI